MQDSHNTMLGLTEDSAVIGSSDQSTDDNALKIDEQNSHDSDSGGK
jgi:hypothetical protein